MTAENRVVGPDGHVDVDFLADFAEGLLSGADAATAEAHIATCADCRATFDALAEVRTLLAGGPAEPMPADVYASIQDALADAAAADALLAETGFRPAAATPASPAGDADSAPDRTDFAAARRAPAVPAAPIVPAPAAPAATPVSQPPADDGGATRFLGAAASAPHAAPPHAADPTRVLGAAPDGPGSGRPGNSGGAGAEDATRVIGAGDVHPFGVAAVPPVRPPAPPMPAPGSAPGGGQVIALDGARRRKRRYVLLAAAAAGVVLVGMGAVTLLGSSSDDGNNDAAGKAPVTAPSQPLDAAPSAAAPAPTRSGGGGRPGSGTAAAPNAPASSPTTLPAYTRADLSARVSALLDRQASAATGVQPGATGSSDPGRTQPGREIPVTLPTCVNAQSGHDKPPTAAELARFEGRTAYVLAYPEPGRHSAEVVVVDAACAFARPGNGDQTAGVLLQTVVPVR